MRYMDLSPKLLTLLQHIQTMDEVEVLLALRRAEGEWRTTAEIARELSADPGVAVSAVDSLRRRGLVTSNGLEPERYRLADDATFRESIDDLATAYETRPVTLVKALYAPRPSSVQAFADAFRIRKPED